MTESIENNKTSNDAREGEKLKNFKDKPDISEEDKQLSETLMMLIERLKVIISINSVRIPGTIPAT